MTVFYEGGGETFFLGARATILDDDRDTASEWASAHVTHNPAIKWILGRYVEADRANRNKQMWTLDDLKNGGQDTIAHTPLNILHRAKHIVGAVQATEMLYPLANAAEGEQDRPFIEALAAMWKTYFPEEMKVVQAAHDMGELFFSMECIAESLTCVGDNGCSESYAYMGPTHPTYCEHINSYASTKQFNKPHFLGAALIFPPARPGWKDAHITDMANLFSEIDDEQLDSIYKMIATETPHLEEKSWENIMAALLEQAKEHHAGVSVSNEEGTKKSPKQIADEVRRAHGRKRR